jgi:hypothetical protein
LVGDRKIPRKVGVGEGISAGPAGEGRIVR